MISVLLQGWMSAHFKTPEERGIVIGLAVTFVFPMSAWMSSTYTLSLDICTLFIPPASHNSRLLSGKARTRVSHRLQGAHRVLNRMYRFDICLSLVVGKGSTGSLP